MTRSFATRRLVSVASLLTLISLVCAPAFAVPVQLRFSGVIDLVAYDIGTTSYSGTTTGTPISGLIVFDNEQPQFSFCQGSTCVHPFIGPEYGGSVIGGPSLPGQSALVIQDDYTFAESEDPFEDLAIANFFLDPDITLNTPIDFWEVGAEVESFDGFSFVAFATLTLNTSLQTSPDFNPVPPTATADEIVFIVEEETNSGGEFFALGRVTNFTTTVIPLPAAGWLLLGGLGILSRFVRRNHRATR